MKIDCSTRWPEATPTLGVTAETYSKACVERWALSLCCTVTVTTERLTHFEEGCFLKTPRNFGCHCRCTSAHRPATNGVFEHFHWQLNAADSIRRKFFKCLRKPAEVCSASNHVQVRTGRFDA
ncbi:uncharacterized protein DEA37_0008854 [Paragonimus westermani]|uniref:Integrase catalytic domain-containing protein n=1 Tax=Paragonimus westermani TaxID=34504 RepID=A0A5J4NSQ3_9TREM|nr:uncharacterized protein DEA37_0008854 [Paragonimus westermani]